MRKNAIWFVVVIAAALIQTTWLKPIRLFGVEPDLTVLLVVYFALKEGEERAMFTGALGGLFQDVASDAVLGHHVLCLVVAGYAVGRICKRLMTDHPAVKAALVFGASLVGGLLFTAISYVQEPGTAAVNTVVARVVPGTFYTAIVTPLAFWFLDTLMRRFPAAQGGTG